MVLLYGLNRRSTSVLLPNLSRSFSTRDQQIYGSLAGNVRAPSSYAAAIAPSCSLLPLLRCSKFCPSCNTLRKKVAFLLPRVFFYSVQCAGIGSISCDGKHVYNGDLSGTYSTLQRCDQEKREGQGCTMKVAYGGGEIEASVIADNFEIDGVL